MISRKSIASKLIESILKKMILLSLFLFSQRISYAQHFDTDSLDGFPPSIFATYKQTISSSKISRCRIFGIYDENKTDSVLDNTYYFDVLGNIVKRETILQGKLYMTLTTLYDDKNRVIEICQKLEKESACFYKLTNKYLPNKVESIIYQNHHDGDTIYFMDGGKPIIMKGWDTTYLQSIYNKKNKLIEINSYNSNRKLIATTTYSYYKNGKLFKKSIVNKERKKKYRYLYTHEFTNGEHNEFMWDDLGKKLSAVYACFFTKEGKCFACKQDYWDVEYFYTTIGLPAIVKHRYNGEFKSIYKYYYD